MTSRLLWLAAVTLAVPCFAAAQDLEIPADTRISLERTHCYGPCPVYTVAIDARGMVTYRGSDYVRVKGRQTVRIERSALVDLLREAKRINLFAMRDVYTGDVTDLPTTIVTLTTNGRTKRIEDYVGAPEDLRRFEGALDAAAGVKRWVFIDEPALVALLASGWRATGEAGAKLLRDAVLRDDVPIARRLLGAGSLLRWPRAQGTPLLLSARSGAMVDLLAAAGADANEDFRGMRPLMWSARRNASVVSALLKAGARVDDISFGATALQQAACGGYWRNVGVLLEAGANPRGAGPRSAVDCARDARKHPLTAPAELLQEPLPTVEDFDRTISILLKAEASRGRP